MQKKLVSKEGQEKWAEHVHEEEAYIIQKGWFD